MANAVMEDLFSMAGRRAIVTGGGGLLGKVFADALLSAGGQVYLVEVDETKLKAAVDALNEKHGGRAVPVACDITDERAVKESIAAIAASGRIDALVNSAAIDPKFETDNQSEAGINGAFTNYSLRNWRRSMDVNLTGAFLLTREVCAVMEKQGEGAVVNVSSTYGLSGPDQRIYLAADGSRTFFKPVDYSVTKAGMLGFTRALAAYYMGSKIRVNALTPGGAYNNHDPVFAANYASKTILGRMARPDEYRGAIIFLCSEASSYMTGANLVVDGGWTAI